MSCSPGGVAGEKTVVTLFPEAAYAQIYVDADDKDQTIKAGPRLNGQQRSRLQSAIYIETIGPDATMDACYIPHHWFRYFDAKGNRIGEVAVCFCCSQIRIDPQPYRAYFPNKIMSGNYRKLEGLVRELGQSTNIGCS
jgi:hypothetical protein